MKWMNSHKEDHDFCTIANTSEKKKKKWFTPTFMILLPSPAKILAKSGCFFLFNSEIEWNIRENL